MENDTNNPTGVGGDQLDHALGGQYAEIRTREEALNWIDDHLGRVTSIAASIRTPMVPRSQHETAYRQFLTMHGGALGMLVALYRCKRITPDDYGRLHGQIMGMLGPSLIIDRYNWASRSQEAAALTSEQAKRWAIEQIARVELVRESCNVVFPDDKGKTVRYQKNAERHLMVGIGGVSGIMIALLRCRMVSGDVYNGLVNRYIRLLVPTVVGGSRC